MIKVLTVVSGKSAVLALHVLSGSVAFTAPRE